MPRGVKRKSNGGAGSGEAAAPSAATAARLSDLHIREFDFSEITKPPVFCIHAPRETGMTILLSSLLVEAQDKLGIDSVVALCDRPSPDGNYMHGVVSKDVVFSKPADKVLKALIGIQAHRLGMDGGAARLPRIALALDDTLYTPKLLRSEAFQCDVKRAKNYNIMIIIATSNCDTLPKSVNTFATHVIATRCISAEEPKQLQKRMFVMFPDAPALVETLALCRRYEFLVGLLYPCDASTNTLVDTTRVYRPTLYVGNDDALRALRERRSWASSMPLTATPTSSATSTPKSFGLDDVSHDGVVDNDEDDEVVNTVRVVRHYAPTTEVTPVVRRIDSNPDFVAHISMVLSRI
jgi:hypothetical protein